MYRNISKMGDQSRPINPTMHYGVRPVTYRGCLKLYPNPWEFTQLLDVPLSWDVRVISLSMWWWLKSLWHLSADRWKHMQVLIWYDNSTTQKHSSLHTFCQNEVIRPAARILYQQWSKSHFYGMTNCGPAHAHCRRSHIVSCSCLSNYLYNLGIQFVI